MPPRASVVSRRALDGRAVLVGLVQQRAVDLGGQSSLGPWHRREAQRRHAEGEHERHRQARRARSPRGGGYARTRYPAPRTVSITEGSFDSVELAAQVAHVDVDDVAASVEVDSPHRVQELLAGQHLPGVPHEVLKQRELPAGQVGLDVIAAPGDPGLGVQVRSPTVNSRAEAAPCLRVGTHACGKLCERERLDQVVVGACVEQGHLVVDLTERAHDDDRNVRSGAIERA